MFRTHAGFAIATAVVFWGAPVAASEPVAEVTLANVEEPAANSPDEPLAEFSVERGKHFLDSAALAWQKQRDCMTCHTNYLYLLSRPRWEPTTKRTRRCAATPKNS